MCVTAKSGDWPLLSLPVGLCARSWQFAPDPSHARHSELAFLAPIASRCPRPEKRVQACYTLYALTPRHWNLSPHPDSHLTNFEAQGLIRADVQRRVYSRKISQDRQLEMSLLRTVRRRQHPDPQPTHGTLRTGYRRPRIASFRVRRPGQGGGCRWKLPSRHRACSSDACRTGVAASVGRRIKDRGKAVTITNSRRYLMPRLVCLVLATAGLLLIVTAV